MALATAVAAIVNTVLLIFFFRKKHPGIRLLSSFKNTGLILLSSVVAIGAAYALFLVLGDTVLNFLIAVVVAVVLYVALILLFKVVTPAMAKESLR